MADPADPDGLRELRHDLRTPLTVVIGFAEMMADAAPLTDVQRREYAQRVLSSALQIRRLVDEA